MKKRISLLVSFSLVFTLLMLFHASAETQPVVTLKMSSEKDVSTSKIFHFTKGTMKIVVKNKGQYVIDFWISKAGSDIAEKYVFAQPYKTKTVFLTNLEEGDYVLKMGCQDGDVGAKGTGKVYIPD